VIVIAEVLRHPQAGVSVLTQEAQEVITRNEVHLSGVHNFSGSIVGLSGNGGTQPEDFSRIGNSHNQRLAFARRS
jgi:hypothetical protein